MAYLSNIRIPSVLDSKLLSAATASGGSVAPSYGKIHWLQTSGSVVEYVDLATAIGAATSGMLWLGPGTFSLSTTVSLSVALVGSGMTNTIISSSVNTTSDVITVSGPGMFNLQIKSFLGTSVPGSPTLVVLNGTPSLVNVYIQGSANPTVVNGIRADNAIAILNGCTVDVDGTALEIAGVSVNSFNTELDGSTYDLVIDSGSPDRSLLSVATRVANGLVSNSGVIQGVLSYGGAAKGSLWFPDSVGISSGIWRTDESLGFRVRHPTIAGAVSSLAAGDSIFLDSDTYGETLDLDVASTTLKGSSPLDTIIEDDAFIILTVSAAARVESLKVSNVRSASGALNAYGISITGNNVILSGVEAQSNPPNATSGNCYGIETEGTGIRLEHCRGVATKSAMTQHGLHVSSGDTTVIGGYYSGAEADIYVDSGATCHMEGPRLEGGGLTIVGTCTGYYIDVSTNEIVIVEPTGGPMVGSQRSLIGLAHGLDGGFSDNPYPVMAHDDDDEFLGLKSIGGDWTWKTGTGYSTPSTGTINNTPSMLRVVKAAADTDISELQATITATANGDDVSYEVLAACPANRNLTDGTYIAIKCTDASTGKFARIRLEYHASDDTLQVVQTYDTGSGETTLDTLAGLPPRIPPFAMAITKYFTSQYVRYQFSIPGVPGAQHLAIDDYLNLKNFGGSGEINIDEVSLQFGNPSGAYVVFLVDSFRVVVT